MSQEDVESAFSIVDDPVLAKKQRLFLRKETLDSILGEKTVRAAGVLIKGLEITTKKLFKEVNKICTDPVQTLLNGILEADPLLAKVRIRQC